MPETFPTDDATAEMAHDMDPKGRRRCQMKWFRFASAVVATLGLSTAAHAGLLDLFGNHGSSKSCGCAPCSQPQCCKPTIKRPCCPTVHTYQRKISDKKPPCCNMGCAPKGCCPKAAKCAAPAASCCPKATCAAPAAKCAAPAANCCPKPMPSCAAPAAKCAAPAPKCAAPAAKCAAPAPSCAAPAAKCCAPMAKGCAPMGKGCCQNKGGCCPQKKCCNADPCEVAKLIYQSQTACYAKDRRAAIHKLGDNYDCQCNPEIMVAFIYALNDADERVRWKAADEIGDQLRNNPCCCSKQVIAALTAALGDCDKGVRHQAEEGLEACGYEVVDGCCDGVSCDPCAKRGCCNNAPPGPAGTPNKSDAPPVPGSEKVYLPTRIRRSFRARRHSRLASLFGLLD